MYMMTLRCRNNVIITLLRCVPVGLACLGSLLTSFTEGVPHSTPKSWKSSFSLFVPKLKWISVLDAYFKMIWQLKWISVLDKQDFARFQFDMLFGQTPSIPANTRCNDNVIIMSKCCCNVVLVSTWWRNNDIMTSWAPGDPLLQQSPGFRVFMMSWRSSILLHLFSPFLW